ncbi:MAG: hypothetical protein V7731_09145 [Amphritea sp.]
MASNNKKVSAEVLRSHPWFVKDDLRSFGHCSGTKQIGYSREEFRGRPVIGIDI